MVNRNTFNFLKVLTLMISVGCMPEQAEEGGHDETVRTPAEDTQATRTRQPAHPSEAAPQLNASDHESSPPQMTPSPQTQASGAPDSAQSTPDRAPSPSADSAAAYEGEAAAGGSAAPAFDDSEDANTEPDEQLEPQENWIQLSTDDSTSMASAQIFKGGARWGNLKAHEFLNYYDPPADLFDAENWAVEAEVTEQIQFGIKAVYTESPQRPIADDEPTVDDAVLDEMNEGNDDGAADASEDGVDQNASNTRQMMPSNIAGETEVLFQLHAQPIAHDVRRNWNLFLCVDVSGSMRGEKMEYTKRALFTMLDHLKAGDRLTLITFDSRAQDVFIDLDFAENEDRIRTAFQNLQPGSSTNMIAGLNRTYELAQANFEESMLHRVILFGDGRANVGDTDLETFADLTRINGQEGIYLSGVGVGRNYDAERMDQLTDAGKGAHVFLPNADEVELIFGDYFPKLVEVAADQVAIEMTLPKGIYLESFSGEEVSTNRAQRLQNIVLAAGDDMTFVAKFKVESDAELDKPASLRVTLRPLSSGRPVVHHIEVAQFSELLGDAGSLFKRTQIVHQFGTWAATGQGDESDILDAIEALPTADWGLLEIAELLARGESD